MLRQGVTCRSVWCAAPSDLPRLRVTGKHPEPHSLSAFGGLGFSRMCSSPVRPRVCWARTRSCSPRWETASGLPPKWCPGEVSPATSSSHWIVENSDTQCPHRGVSRVSTLIQFRLELPRPHLGAASVPLHVSELSLCLCMEFGPEAASCPAVWKFGQSQL